MLAIIPIKTQACKRELIKESFAWIEQLRDFQHSDISTDLYLKRLRTDFFRMGYLSLPQRGDVIDLP